MSSEKQLKKHRICHAILWFVSAVMFFSSAYAKETVVIVAVPEGDKVVTADGDTLVLANVQTVSINDPDSLRAEFARTVIADAAKILNGKQVEIEPITMLDSAQVVLVWLPSTLGKKSVNAHYLEKGWGFLKEMPAHRSLEEFRWYAQRAEAAKVGVYAEKAETQKPLLPNALWLSGGIGFSRSGRPGGLWEDYYTEFALNGSIAFRHKLFIGDIGANLIYSSDYGGTRTYYLTFGMSAHNRTGEFTAAIGPSLSRWIYNTESERGTIHSDAFWGGMIKMQTFVHAPHSIGMGIELSANFNSDQTTYMMSFNLYSGVWNF
jgi:hypothetical protein